MIEFGIKDIIDILLVALLLFYLYKMMKESGSLNIFIGVLAFIVVWVVSSEILEMRLIGTILGKVMNIGLIIFVILFQEPIKRFLVGLGSHKNWRAIRRFVNKHNDVETDDKAWIMPIVRACMSMSKQKTGALIVIEREHSLDKYERLGDIIDAKINARLIENIFFKNSPLHDGAMIISHNKISACGCILPVSHDSSLPRNLGLRHRSALGITQVCDAVSIVVSEETGNISVAKDATIRLKLTVTELEHFLSSL